jgi:hypothetical protein
MKKLLVLYHFFGFSNVNAKSWSCKMDNKMHVTLCWRIIEKTGMCIRSLLGGGGPLPLELYLKTKG